tara:strand:+ start:5260 stop:6003 length:744 start_codon:yes stop_codon:yes gene_type:complete
MTESKSLNKGMIAPLPNVALFAELLDRVMNRSIHLPGLAIFYGFSGFGKTWAATYGAHAFRAYYVEAGFSWTRKKFLQAILVELGAQPDGTIPDMVDQLIDVLAKIDRPLIIDEFDYIVEKNYVELIREIHDKSQAPIILIGEERLPKKLVKWERFHNRILDWVPAQPLAVSDMRVLADHADTDVHIKDDLLKHVHGLINGRTRRAAVNIALIAEKAKLRGLTEISLTEWDDEPLYIGEASARGERM